MKMKLKRILQIAIVILLIILSSIVIKNVYEGIRFNRLIEEIQNTSKKGNVSGNEDYVSPINFTELKAVNEDIYAWLKIPDTNVDLPVVQKKDDNSFYVHRDVKGKNASGGSLFTENYNTLTFEDKVTVIYGHNMRSGAMFGEMKKFSNQEYFDEHSELIVYLPDCEKKYSLVAAVPFDNRHLLHNKNYYNPEAFEGLAYELMHIRDINSRYAKQAKIEKKDRILILSTCYFNNNNMRFLTVWKEIRSDINEDND